VQTTERRRTKLIASVDAESCTAESITSLVEAGMNLVHLEEGDGGTAAIEAAYGTVRAAAHEVRTPVGILVDVDGAAGDEQSDRVRVLAELGVDFLAVRCVRDAPGVERVRSFLPDGSLAQLLAAVEHADALASAEGLADAADGLIVAVGGPDTGMEVEDVPVVQRHLLALARSVRKPCVITADPAMGVVGGADAMLIVDEGSDRAEVESIALADGIARRLEADLVGDPVPASVERSGDHALTPVELVALQAAAGAGDTDEVRGVIVLPSPGSGAAARVLSSEHPAVPVIGCALSVPEMTKMSILGGVIPRFIPPGGPEDPDELARTIAAQLSLGETGDAVVTVEGVADGKTPRVSLVAL
jgi:pyruvate kinase